MLQQGQTAGPVELLRGIGEKCGRRLWAGLPYCNYFWVAQTIEQFSLAVMNYIYPINFVGHDEWLKSGYEPEMAQGDVVTRDGEFLGIWRVVDYDHQDECSSGRIEFIPDAESIVKFSENFAALDVRTSRGLALSHITRNIKAWHEEQPS